MADESADPEVGDLARGASLALANAEALFSEAQALFACGALARALFLHQISLEECAKIEILGWCATGHLMGEPVDLSKMRSRFTSHRAKNFTNAYMLPACEAELEARGRADWRASLEAFKEKQASFHQEANDRKNAALYVDYVDGVFVSPQDRVTREMVRETADRNHQFIELMRPCVEMLSRWATEGSEQVRRTLQTFRTRMEELREELPDEPQKVLELVLEEMVKEARRAQHAGAQDGESAGAPPPPVT